MEKRDYIAGAVVRVLPPPEGARMFRRAFYEVNEGRELVVESSTLRSGDCFVKLRGVPTPVNARWLQVIGFEGGGRQTNIEGDDIEAEH